MWLPPGDAPGLTHPFPADRQLDAGASILPAACGVLADEVEHRLGVRDAKGWDAVSELAL
eukprot:7931188-Lingulodinium_polyedra.AAC.1